MAETVAIWAVTAVEGGAYATGAAAFAANAVVYAGAYIATTAAIAYGTGALLSSLAKNKNAGDANAGRDIMIRSGVAPKRIIYGRDRVSGPLVFAGTADATSGNPYLTDRVLLTSTVHNTMGVSVGEGALGGVTPYTLDENNNITYGTPFTPVGGAPGPQEYAETMGQYTFNAADLGKNVEIRYLFTRGERNYYLFMVVALAAHECDAIEKVYINGDEIDCSTQLDVDGNVTSGKYAVYVTIRTHLGTSSQTVDTLLNTYMPSQWTSAHRLKDTCYLVIRFQANWELYNAEPQIAALVRGKKVYVNRTGLTVWSNNPADCIADFCRADYGFAASAARVNYTSVDTAANACDESVVKPGGGTHTRYVLDGSFTLDVPPPETLKAMLNAMVGYWVYSGGKINIFAGVYVSPTGPTLVRSMLRAPLSFPAKPSRREVINIVRGRHVSDTKDYKETDYPPIIMTSYITDDGGVEYPYNLDLPFVHDPERCQRIAKTHVRKLRQGLRIVWPGKLSCYEYKIGQTVNVTLSEFGWSSKKFVVVDWQFSFDGGVDLVLQEEDPTAYDWIEADSIAVDPNPDTSLPSPFNVQPIASFAAASGTSELQLNPDGTIVPRVKVTWTIPERQYMRGGKVEIWTKLNSDLVWRGTPFSVDAMAGQTHILGLQTGLQYDIAGRFINELGFSGPWSVVVAHTVTGETQRPTKPTNFALAILNDRTRRFTWSPITDADLRGYEIRYSGSTTEWNSAQSILNSGGVITEAAYETNLPPVGIYNLLLASWDRSGNVSSATILSSLSITDEPTTFTEGVGVNMYQNGSFNMPFAGPTGGVGPYLYRGVVDPGGVGGTKTFSNVDSSHWLRGQRGLRIHTIVDSKQINYVLFSRVYNPSAVGDDFPNDRFLVDPNARYSISARIAASKCDAALGFTVTLASSAAGDLSVASMTLQSSVGTGMYIVGTITSAESFVGGAENSNYKYVGALFTTPASAALLNVRLEKGNTYTPDSGSYVELHELMIAKAHTAQQSPTPFSSPDIMLSTVATDQAYPNAFTDEYRSTLAGAVALTANTFTSAHSFGDVFMTTNGAIEVAYTGQAYSYSVGSSTHSFIARLSARYRYPGSTDTTTYFSGSGGNIQFATYNGAGVTAQGNVALRDTMTVQSGMYYGFSLDGYPFNTSSSELQRGVMTLTAAKR